VRWLCLPLLVGGGILLASVLLYGLAMALIVQLVVRLIRTGYTGLRFWKNAAVLLIVTFITAAAHLIQIALWAVALLLVGEMANYERAFYVSAENDTALGYGDLTLSQR
jgi:hypothetical protein